MQRKSCPEREHQRLMEHYRKQRTRADLGPESWSQADGRGLKESDRVRQADVNWALRAGAGTFQKVVSGGYALPPSSTRPSRSCSASARTTL
ncbi:hypothetical protein [Streptomyces sp. AM 2-1-1]|uniref:hypothetical protein n=1 Tax=Streptomyces sp. AM 2-1-1 TaxID=3028709 RepID=UPI0023B8AF93|nr:hypothetical protein [Streptomyces sp. AM 2-1-1]WEH38418.1 hypothetical protein PZB77_02235 [Streptomyces sp. AM 2-1-1]